MFHCASVAALDIWPNGAARAFGQVPLMTKYPKQALGAGRTGSIAMGQYRYPDLPLIQAVRRVDVITTTPSLTIRDEGPLLDAITKDPARMSTSVCCCCRAGAVGDLPGVISGEK